MLKNILLECSAAVGISLTEVDKRAWLIAKINAAAEEIYNSGDNAGCMREQVFTVESTQQQVTLPYYVDKIRAAREWNTSRKMHLNDMRPRYQTSKWRQPFLFWRVKGVVALKRDLGNQGTITCIFGEAVTARTKVVITGSTSTASRTAETLTYEVGDTSKTTTKSFTSIESISKSVTTVADLTIYDASANTIAEIPNHELSSRYTLVQVTDEESPQLSPNNVFEVLYKIRFSPFINDTDEFPCPGFDKAIYWKVLEHIWAEQKDRVDAAIMAGQKCAAIINQLNANDSGGIEIEMDFGRPRYSGIQDSPTMNPYSSANPFGSYGGINQP